MINTPNTLEDVIEEMQKELKKIEIEIDNLNKIHEKILLYKLYLENIKNNNKGE